MSLDSEDNMSSAKTSFRIIPTCDGCDHIFRKGETIVNVRKENYMSLPEERHLCKSCWMKEKEVTPADVTSGRTHVSQSTAQGLTEQEHQMAKRDWMKSRDRFAKRKR